MPMRQSLHRSLPKLRYCSNAVGCYETRSTTWRDSVTVPSIALWPSKTSAHHDPTQTGCPCARATLAMSSRQAWSRGPRNQGKCTWGKRRLPCTYRRRLRQACSAPARGGQHRRRGTTSRLVQPGSKRPALSKPSTHHVPTDTGKLVLELRAVLQVLRNASLLGLCALDE